MSYFGNTELLDLETSRQSAFGEQIIIQETPITQGTFEYTVDNTKITTNTTSGSGSVTQSNAMAVCATGLNAGSYGYLRTKQGLKYRSGFGAVDKFTTRFIVPSSDNVVLAGLADEIGSGASFKNGLMVGYNGNTTFGFHRFVNDSVVTVNQSSWDDPLDGTGRSGMTLNPLKLNVWKVQYQFLGAGSIQLYVEADATAKKHLKGKLILVHQINYTNLNDNPHIFNPNMYHTLYCGNATTSQNFALYSASFMLAVQGKHNLQELQQPHQSSGLITKAGISSEVALFSVRNKSTYASKTNFIDSLIERAMVQTEANANSNLARVRLVKNGTLGGTPAWNDLNTSDSVLELDIAGTTVTGGQELTVLPLSGKNAQAFENLTDYDFVLNPNEWVSFAISSTNQVTVDGQLLFKDLF